MASPCTADGVFNMNLKHFPPVINGRLNVVEFLEASSSLVTVIERLGTLFAPVKYDIQGNIDKIKKLYKYDENTCLLEIINEEVANSKAIGAESVLWLNRSLLFFELVFQGIIEHLQVNKLNVDMKGIFTIAYEGSVKKYHNWVTQQLFTVICKISPTLPQIMKSLGVDNNVKEFETKISGFNVTLHLVRCKIDDFFQENNIFNISQQT